MIKNINEKIYEDNDANEFKHDNNNFDFKLLIYKNVYIKSEFLYVPFIIDETDNITKLFVLNKITNQ